MTKKLRFYDRYGVQEYYIYDPERNDFTGLQRLNGCLEVIETISDWVSPLLGICFALADETLQVYYLDGRAFLTTVELSQCVEQERQRAEQERQAKDRLAAKLRELGIDPEMLE